MDMIREIEIVSGHSFHLDFLYDAQLLLLNYVIAIRRRQGEKSLDIAIIWPLASACYSHDGLHKKDAGHHDLALKLCRFAECSSTTFSVSLRLVQTIAWWLLICYELFEYLSKHLPDPPTLSWDECCFVSVDFFSQTTETQISSAWSHIGALEDHLPKNKSHTEETNHRVREEQPHRRPTTFEEHVITSS